MCREALGFCQQSLWVEDTGSSGLCLQRAARRPGCPAGPSALLAMNPHPLLFLRHRLHNCNVMTGCIEFTLKLRVSFSRESCSCAVLLPPAPPTPRPPPTPPWRPGGSWQVTAVAVSRVPLEQMMRFPWLHGFPSRVFPWLLSCRPCHSRGLWGEGECSPCGGLLPGPGRGRRASWLPCGQSGARPVLCCLRLSVQTPPRSFGSL